MWAEHCHRLEPLPLLSAQWQRLLLDCGGQIFFTHNIYLFSMVFVNSLRSVGGVFDKRVGMLFPIPASGIRNVHRRGDYSLTSFVHEIASLSSKTVTKNMRVGFFKNQKIKERPQNAPERGSTITADTAERSFLPVILAGISCFLSSFFSRCVRLTLKSAFQIARMMKVYLRWSFGSGFPPVRWTHQHSEMEDNPEALTFFAILTVDPPSLTMINPDAFIELTPASNGLTLPPILTAVVDALSG
jgi:hypothetical protein